MKAKKWNFFFELWNHKGHPISRPSGRAMGHPPEFSWWISIYIYTPRDIGNELYWDMFGFQWINSWNCLTLKVDIWSLTFINTHMYHQRVFLGQKTLWAWSLLIDMVIRLYTPDMSRSYILLLLHRYGNVAIPTKLPSSAPLEVVITTTSSAASDGNLMRKTTSLLR